MFEKQDSILLTIRFVVNLLLILTGVAGIIFGIVFAVIEDVLIGLLIMFLVPVSCFFAWLFWKLLFSYLCDIKLIRNKLYGTDNNNLQVFLKNDKKEIE